MSKEKDRRSRRLKILELIKKTLEYESEAGWPPRTGLDGESWLRPYSHHGAIESKSSSSMNPRNLEGQAERGATAAVWAESR